MAYHALTGARMVVLDDDPTGIQTVHGCLLVTQWDDATLEAAFQDSVPFFYILTNTRAMTRQQAALTTRSAMEAVVRVNRRHGHRLIIVSRSDSCLRGHFPLETDVMRSVLAGAGIAVAAKTPFCPAFIEAGRVTIGGVHYMRDAAGTLLPVSETEFARDNVFAYHTSVLADYIAEKGARPDDYVIIDAQDYTELNVRLDPILAEAESRGQALVVRSSSSLPKAVAGLPDQPLLSRDQLRGSSTKKKLSPTDVKLSSTEISQSAAAGVGLFIVGSHVQKTTRQLSQLLAAQGTEGLELDVNLMLSQPQTLMDATLARLSELAAAGLTPVVYTQRQEVRLGNADQRQRLGQQVSQFLVDIVRRLPFTPAYLVAKGGITSHDILTSGLGVSSARVMGQVVGSVPAIMTSRFPYIIFPGNVGTDESLREVYEKLA